MFGPCFAPPCLNLIRFHPLHLCSVHPIFHRHRKFHQVSRHLGRLSRHIAVQLSHVHQVHLTTSVPPALQRDLQRVPSRAHIAHSSSQLMPASMALISMNTGSLTKTPTTTRRSMDSLHAPSGRRLSLQKLDIEGCDPLSLPLAALLYQQANNHWMRKLASGREIYILDPYWRHRIRGVHDGTPQTVPDQGHRP